MAVYSRNLITLLLACLIYFELQTVSALPEHPFKRDTACETFFCPDPDILAPLLNLWPFGRPQLPNLPPPQTQPVPETPSPAPDVNPGASGNKSPGPNSGQVLDTPPLMDPQIEILKIEPNPGTQKCQAVANSNSLDSQPVQVSLEIYMRLNCCLGCLMPLRIYRKIQIHAGAKKLRSGLFSL